MALVVGKKEPAAPSFVIIHRQRYFVLEQMGRGGCAPAFYNVIRFGNITNLSGAELRRGVGEVAPKGA